MNTQQDIKQLADLFNQAVIHQRDGENEEAEKLYLNILERERILPEGSGQTPQATAMKTVFSQVHNNIGLFREEEEKFNLAIDCFRTALDYAPGNVEAHTNLSRIFLKKRNLDKALEYAKKALQLRPEYGPAIIQLCAASYELGVTGEALEVLERSEKGRRPSPRFYIEYGRILEKAGRLDEAREKLLRALELKSDHLYALLNLANVNFQLARYEEALENYRAILAVNPQHVEAHTGMGYLFQTMGRVGDAINLYRTALAINPVHRETLSFMSSALAVTGEHQEALTMVNNLLEMPKLSERAFIGAKLTRARCEIALGRPEEAIATLESIKSITKNSAQRHRLFHDLGVSYDRMGKTGEAFQAFVRSNEEFLKGAEPFQKKRAEFRKIVEDLKAFDMKACFEGGAGKKPEKGAVPRVFVVGFLFSGAHTISRLLDGMPGINVHEDSYILNGLRIRLAKSPGGYPGSLATMSDEDIGAQRALFDDLSEKLLGASADAISIHTFPMNLLDLPLILKMFPDARIVFANNHPCDSVLNTYMKDFIHNPSTVEFARLETTAEVYGNAMDLWKKYQKELPLKFLEIRYEDLMKAPAKELGRLLKFIGHKDLTAAKTFMKDDAFFNAVEEQSTLYPPGRWKRYEVHMEPVLGDLKPYAKMLGYKI